MTRLHPQDLRAIMAAILQGSTHTLVQGTQWQFTGTPRGTVEEADALLAELERTAPCPLCHVVTMAGATEKAHAPGCGLDFRIVTGEESAPIGPDPREFARPGDIHIPQSPPSPAEARAEGARDERERIIAVLVNPHPKDLIYNWDAYGDHLEVVLRDILEHP